MFCGFRGYDKAMKSGGCGTNQFVAAPEQPPIGTQLRITIDLPLRINPIVKMLPESRSLPTELIFGKAIGIDDLDMSRFSHDVVTIEQRINQARDFGSLLPESIRFLGGQNKTSATQNVPCAGDVGICSKRLSACHVCTNAKVRV